VTLHHGGRQLVIFIIIACLRKALHIPAPELGYCLPPLQWCNIRKTLWSLSKRNSVFKNAQQIWHLRHVYYHYRWRWTEANWCNRLSFSVPLLVRTSFLYYIIARLYHSWQAIPSFPVYVVMYYLWDGSLLIGHMLWCMSVFGHLGPVGSGTTPFSR
jgi:hypothetical protein